MRLFFWPRTIFGSLGLLGVITAVEKKASLSIALQTPGHCRDRTEIPVKVLLLRREMPRHGTEVLHKYTVGLMWLR